MHQPFNDDPLETALLRPSGWQRFVRMLAKAAAAKVVDAFVNAWLGPLPGAVVRFVFGQADSND